MNSTFFKRSSFAIFLVLFVWLTPVLCSSEIQPPGGEYGKERVLLFQSGFEPGSTIKHGNNPLTASDMIIGRDNSVPSPNDWVEDLVNSKKIGDRFILQYQGGDTTQRYARIIQEPGNPSNHVLHFWLNEPNVDGTKGRIQANLYGATEGLKEFYQSVRIFLPEDFNTVRKFPEKITWLTIFEFWNNIGWVPELPYPFRVTVGIGKPLVGESDLYFMIHGQNQVSENWTTLWHEVNQNIKVPIGKWFTIDYYYKEGDAQNGRFWMSMQPEGGEKQVVFDVTNYTHNSGDENPDGVTDFNPLKLYTSKTLIDFMRSNEKTLQIYWDDFKLWEVITLEDFPSANANLAAITWPDIPAFYRDFMDWKGDTIPFFSSDASSYKLEVPYDVEGIPALVAKAQHVNASVKTTRAKSITGSAADRTITFEVTAENDTFKRIYTVELVKEKFPDKIEPYRADPFISEFVNAYLGNAYIEIYNPGTEPLDLRDYMIGLRGGAGNNDLYAPINFTPSWLRRYTTYIPGLKYVDAETWAVTPRTLVPDVNVNPILQGGQTFVMGYVIRGEANTPGIFFPPYDMQFANETIPGHPNPWGEAMEAASAWGVPMPSNGNRNNSFFLYKILNDSIKLGLKPNNNPNDFELIDIWGMENNAYWVIGGVALAVNGSGDIYIRKPHVYKGNPVRGDGSSFGTNPGNSEWTRVVPNTAFGTIPIPERYAAALASLNNHTFTMPTFHMSTVTSLLYKVSDGYGPGEQILGIITGTTVADFLSKIYKDDEGQSLTVTSADDTELATDAMLSMNDKLVVVSTDGQNTTTYRLDVDAVGLSTNAVITSTQWDISIVEGEGAISGFSYGTTLKSITDNIIVPGGATLTVIDGRNGNYVPFTTVNFDTAYVNVTVNSNIYLDVVAEDNLTRIVYQLKPATTENDAFIFSDIYTVTQSINLIELVPRGTSPGALLANVNAPEGATMKIVDKMGFERVLGSIREDDKLVVTSSNGLVSRVYFISFLPTVNIPSTTYLAYVLSDSYAIDQVNYLISGASSNLNVSTMVSEFFSNITACEGASAVVIDGDGNEKTSGNLNQGDVLKVTSADQKFNVIYQLILVTTSTGNIGQEQIKIYPNPTSEVINISGIEAGNRIRLFNTTGELILDRIAGGNFEVLPLDRLSSGMFFIVISNENKLVGRFKAIKN